MNIFRYLLYSHNTFERMRVYLGPNKLGLSGFAHSLAKVHESFKLLSGADSCLQIINHSILNAKCMSHKFATHTCSCTDSTVLLRKLEIEYHK